MEKVLYSDIENPSRHQSFVVFEPASVRISDADILYQGDDVRRVFDGFIEQLISKEHTIKEKILHNRLSKIGNMLDLLQTHDNVIITRFFDRIWRRYSYVTHLGEAFLDFETFTAYVPEGKENVSEFLALRYDRGDSLEEGPEVGDSVENDSGDDAKAKVKAKDKPESKEKDKEKG